MEKPPETTESGVEYGLPPTDSLKQGKVMVLFEETWAKLRKISGDNPRDRQKIGREIRHLMDQLSSLHIELPCQGVEYRGVVVDRDPEVYEDIPPAPFIEWGRALGVPLTLPKR